LVAAIYAAGGHFLNQNIRLLANCDTESSIKFDQAFLQVTGSERFQAARLVDYNDTHPPMAPLIHCSRLAAGCAPEIRAISLPDRKMASVGMLRMPYSAPKAYSSSAFTLMKRTRESIRAHTLANAGAIDLHGPHQGAKKSNTHSSQFIGNE
jgi:hypothetical protein